MTDPAKAQLEAIAHRGIDALRRGDAAAARSAFDAIAASGRATPQIWLFLAQSCDMQDDRTAARAALAQVLAADPANPYALVMQGEIFTRDGDDRAASAWYDRALAAAAGIGQLPADLVARLQRAEAERVAIAGRFTAAMHAALAAAGVDGDAAGPRFAESLAIVAGATRPYLQEPTSFYFPGLPQQAFYDPADFAWVAALEAAFPAIRTEAEAVLADRAGTAPYVEAPRDRPAKAHSLLDDPRWSAFHLIQHGLPVAANAARCPATMAAIADLPIPVIAGRSPMVLFSLLAPGTHIAPHTGMLNTRLICHLPLIVPPDCRLRVGNTTRNVEAGKMLIFDDSIEHEAWNDSDAMRVILLFEIWRPELTLAERAGLTALFESISVYGAE
ncbi:aspartyl/asparaginyl beta-hydroxylase domain-containing protein [Polymorphobacter fuscus]|uniref:Aspartyl/asparaginyl beta-hydroxylase domain-containing protein n=2 Tax=Sandarakinorhabdus fusca TaxID=1439888 RepID=A0A7C9GQG2_9SPHN|nr:aspartyl/asparaginyl beta-hydroxylase domain-containing protein [Polymorphobacter fuscus]KAB7646401.1 aspartyl/asparaginyl beta-hydroxylase domain-containing protein [Polymorphobacter fuscus]MQT17636.1 aspartyl/asparaginyl beta-hydroxylase domain-containing protein [Polymorphobacter fuscus]